jgi:hypothetical protein
LVNLKAALRMTRLPVVKTLAGYDFSFQPSLDCNRIPALAGLDSIERAEVVHLLGRLAPERSTLPQRWRSRPCAPARRFTSSRSLI